MIEETGTYGSSSSTFMLCILGTDLTRSGLVSSVHALCAVFHRQLVYWPFWWVVLSICLFHFPQASGIISSQSNKLESLVSRESSFPLQ